MITNEPINRVEGNIELADLEAVTAAEYRQALAILKVVGAGPIWPKPVESALTGDQVFERIAVGVEMGHHQPQSQSRSRCCDLPDICLMGIVTGEQVDQQIAAIKREVAKTVGDIEAIRVYRHAVSSCNPSGSLIWVRVFVK